MTKYFLKRLLFAFLMLILIMTILYFLVVGLGPSPITRDSFDTELEYRNALAAAGLDESIFIRYFKWWGNIISGKGFGMIYNEEMRVYDTVTQLFFEPLKYTLWLSIPTYFLSIILGVSLGIFAGYKRGTWIDTLINAFTVFFIGVPSFIIASLALGFGDKLGLPISFIDPETSGYGKMILSFILPIIILTLSSLSIFTYNTRNEIASVLSSQYVNIARTKGMSEWKIFTKYVMRNASLPLINLIVPYYTILLAGSFVLETFFQIPGSSYVIVQSLKQGEYNIIMFNAFFFVMLGLLNGIIVDILYILLDPRIVYGNVSKFKFIENIKKANLRKQISEEELVPSTNEVVEGGNNE